MVPGGFLLSLDMATKNRPYDIPAQNEEVLQKIREGYSVSDACKHAGCTYTAFKLRRYNHPKLNEQYIAAKQEQIDSFKEEASTRLAEKLMERLEKQERTIKVTQTKNENGEWVETERVVIQRPTNPAIAIFLAKKLLPGFDDKLELSGQVAMQAPTIEVCGPKQEGE